MSHDVAPPGPLRLAGRPLTLLGPVRIYACGVTPYDVTHLGHAATFVWVDLAARVLRHAGAEVVLTRNVTDVDDVLTEAARRAGSPYDSFAAVHQFRFDHDMSALHVGRPTHEPRAHNHVRPVVALAAALLEVGAAYERNGTVWFRGGAVAQRAGLDRAAALAACAEFGEVPNDPEKDDPLDVPVWRSSRGDEPAWPSPWGSGRPGWHAECAAMVLTFYGPSVDLHAGGADLAFPHHAYEAAMVEAASGVAPFARAWMRMGTVRVGGAKMAKSTGNLVLVEQLLAEHRAEAVRLMLLMRPFAEAWDYEHDLVRVAEDRLEALYGAAGRPGGSDAAEAALTARLLDGLDTVGALSLAEEEGGRTARSLLRTLALG